MIYLQSDKKLKVYVNEDIMFRLKMKIKYLKKEDADNFLSVLKESITKNER